jgi:CubicO group peptidase (beta-lactamase class C family)
MFTLFIGWNNWPERNTIPSEKKSIKLSKVQVEQIDTFMQYQYKQGKYPSLSVAIWRDNEVIYSQAIGYADLAKGKAADTNTQYRIGSSSKAVNGSLAAYLVDNAKLNLDKPIIEYIDYVDEDYTAITTRQLLSHTAGVKHYGLCLCFPIWDYENTTYFGSVEKAIATFSDSALLFKPGTDFSYSTYGTVLSSGIIEAVGGASYLTLIEEHLSKPFGLKGLKPDMKTIINDNRSISYDVYDDAYKVSEFIDSSIKWAGGGFVARPTDLAKLGGTWLNDKLVSSGVRETFWTPQTTLNGDINRQHYALGWRVSERKNVNNPSAPVKVVHHNGTARGAISNFELYPEHNLVISVMANRSQRRSEDSFMSLASQLGEMLIGFNENATQQ